MAQSLSRVYLHIVFSTKDRYPFLSEPALRTEMHSYLAGVSNKLGMQPVEIGGVADHVHMLVLFPRTLTIANAVKEVKRNSSLWAKDRNLSKFAWQTGYGSFSVSPSNVDEVVRYIKNQEAHHKTQSFQEEYRLLLEKHSVEYDERYVWD